MLADVPARVPVQQTSGPEGVGFYGGHDGYLPTHGLTHVRRLDLSPDGGELTGEDTLATDLDSDRDVFDAAMDRLQLQGIPYGVHFHLHPEVDAMLDMGDTAVSLVLRSGEIWVFRHDGQAALSLEPSVYLEKGRLKPRATKQIVLSGRVLDYGGRIGWSFSKAQDSPENLRDLERDEDLMAKQTT